MEETITYRPKRPLKYFIFIVLVLATFVLGTTVGYETRRHEDGTSVGPVGVTGENTTSGSGECGYAGQYPKVWTIYQKIKDRHINDKILDTRENIEDGLIRGLTTALDDPYTVYLNKKETQEFSESLSGDLHGIGAELMIEKGQLTVVTPLKNTPAEKAGLKTGDVIFKIGSEATADMSLVEAVSKIRGPANTKVHLVVIRNSQPVEMDIMREDIKIPSVSWKMLEGVAYVEINQFGDTTVQEFEEAVSQIVLNKAKGIILDLRNNGGGYLEDAIFVISEFVKEGNAVTVRRRTGETFEEYPVKGRARLANLPAVVLINEASASAAEIVAGALKDYKKATIVGIKSYGKGTVQEFETLTDGSSIRITVARWYTPLGNSIDKEGITPDVVVENPTGSQREDKQLEKAQAILNQ